MCGLVSIVARRPMGFNSKTLDMFEQMLIFDTVRGKDSTGVINIRRDGSVDMMKQAEQPYFMLRCQQWNQFRLRSTGEGRILAGHNRAATRGNVTNENAHPFYEKNIVLMHNGTLDYGWEKLTTEKVEVDSHAICHALTEGTPQKVIPTIEGAFALLWFDMETELFHAVRNDQRPLSLITTDDFYFLASESWMATIPCIRERIKVIESKEIEPGELLTFNLRGELKTEPVGLHQDPQMAARYKAWMASQGVAGTWEDDLGEALPLKGTQVTFPAAKKDCSPASPMQKTCALTSTSTTNSDSKSKKVGGEDGLTSLEAQQQSLKVELADLPKGREIAVKIWDVKALPNGAIKWTGKVVEPGVEMYDAQGFLPRSLLGNEWPRWMEFPILAKVGWCTKTVCGISVYVRDCELLPQTLAHNAQVVSERLWHHVTDTCSCRDCGGLIEDWERGWTSVKTKGVHGKTQSGNPINAVEVVCPDCIMKALDGEFYAKYSQTYYQKKLAVQQDRKGQPATSRSAAIQDSESVSGEPVGKNGSVIVVPSGTTLQ